MASDPFAAVRQGFLISAVVVFGRLVHCGLPSSIPAFSPFRPRDTPNQPHPQPPSGFSLLEATPCLGLCPRYCGMFLVLPARIPDLAVVIARGDYRRVWGRGRRHSTVVLETFGVLDPVPV